MDFISRPLRFYCDNSTDVFLSKISKRADKENEVLIEHIRTELMIADPLRKGMPPNLFEDLVMQMGHCNLIYSYLI